MTLRGRLLLALAYILLLAIVALEVPLAISLRDRVDAEVRSQARSQADVVAASVAGNLDDPESLDETVRRASKAARGRVVVTDTGGALLADSAGTDRLGTDYGDRPEIAQALRTGSSVQDRRRSDTLDQEILARANRVANALDDRIRGRPPKTFNPLNRRWVVARNCRTGTP